VSSNWGVSKNLRLSSQIHWLRRPKCTRRQTRRC
jgi:hypothetical protein